MPISHAFLFPNNLYIVQMIINKKIIVIYYKLSGFSN